MRLLIKYPTRRADQFIKTLGIYSAMCHDPINTAMVVSVDDDDEAMRSDAVWKAIEECRFDVQVVEGPAKGKIHAINRDIPTDGWDIILLASDDMIPTQDYDRAIREAIGYDLDQYLWIHDGRQDRINTIECVGSLYYRRTGYLYHHSYRSLWCDNEATDLGVRSGKFVRLPCIIKNESPDWGGSNPRDDLYRSNNKYFNVDKMNYLVRKANNFPA